MMDYYEELRASQSLYPSIEDGGDPLTFSGWTILHGSGEWSAVYDADGILVFYEDTPQVFDWIEARLEVQVEYDIHHDDWILAAGRPIPLMEDIYRRIAARKLRRDEAALLRVEANELLSKSGELITQAKELEA